MHWKILAGIQFILLVLRSKDKQPLPDKRTWQFIFVPESASISFQMMLFVRRLKKAIKTLISKDTILNIPIDGIFKMVGESNIKTFIQIGSNDGRKNDPLYKYIRKNAWKGILVEPDL